jgi:hypothetical protein
MSIELDRVAAAVKRASQGLGWAQLAMAFVHQTGNREKLPDAIRQAEAAKQDANNALAILLGLGAARPGPSVARDTVPLALLNTPETRALLDALEAAARAGAAVDHQRGWVNDVGEAIGFGETLDGMAFQLRMEIFGPRGRDGRQS